MDNEITFETRMGWIELAWTEAGLRRLRLFGEARPVGNRNPALLPDWVADAVARITRFLAGEPADLATIPVDLDGLPPFQRKVLQALRETKTGDTITYGQLALLVGSPGCARAVGQTMARNPLPIVIPCHRVVAANGPGGFSLFGSLESKERLLALEGVRLRNTGPACEPLFPMNF